MIDWHSHVLPEMDDGSKNTCESIAMLKLLAEQGVDTVVATPHYYANDESPERFLERREESFSKLCKERAEHSPQILLGAEVRYYQGISRLSELKRLRIQSSPLLLLEMPQGEWTEYTLREICFLSGSQEIKLVLAHIERYLKYQNFDTWERLYDSGILMQVNASFFTRFTTRAKALTLLKNQKVSFIGSDCHNLTSRAPKIGRAFEIIEKNTSPDFIGQMNEYGYKILKKAD